MVFSPLPGNDNNKGGRRGNPTRGDGFCFSAWSNGNGNWEETVSTSGDTWGPLFAHGPGGIVVRARLGVAKKKTEKRTIVTFLVSPPSQYTCVPTRTAHGPSSAAGCRLDYDLCTALRCFASLSRGGASDEAWADELPSTWVAVVAERTSWFSRYIRSVTEDFGPCCCDGQADAGRLTIIRRRR